MPEEPEQRQERFLTGSVLGGPSCRAAGLQPPSRPHPLPSPLPPHLPLLPVGTYVFRLLGPGLMA